MPVEMLAVHVTATSGFSITVAVADFVGSAAETAVTVIAWVAPIEAGAVYSPELEMVPTLELSDHVTAVLDVPATVAVNCWVCESFSAAVPGVTDIETVLVGFNVTVAVADFDASTTLTAVTVTVCWAAMLAGAVYSPALLIEPAFGVSAQVTALLPDPPVTVAVNCVVWFAASEDVAGVTVTLTVSTSVIVAVWLLPFSPAVRVALRLGVRVPAMAVNDAVVLPPATVTEPGTVRLLLLLESDTTVPDDAAGRDKATVHVVAAPEAKVVGLHPRLLTVRGARAISKLLGISMKQTNVLRTHFCLGMDSPIQRPTLVL